MKFGLKIRMILLFILVSIGSLMILNNVIQVQQQNIQNAMEKLELGTQLRDIHYLDHGDSLRAESIMREFHAAKAAVNISLTQSRMISGVVLLLVIVASSIVFIIVLARISKPLTEMKKATEQIRQGNYSVHLAETGIPEMRELKSSFNLMSRELESTQNRLLVAEKEMIWKDLSRILAHEIKNPLTPIQLAIQRLEERLESDPEHIRDILPESIAIITQEIENLRLLAQDFSSFAKITQPNTETFDPASSIKDIIKSYTADYQIETDLAQSTRIAFDKTHFYQIVTNILQNAIDASEPERPIHIKLFRERSFVVLSIRDAGCGIEPQDLHRIFEPYFSRKTKGTGLGLALVKKLCDSNSAIIRVKSKPGEGSEFTVIIESSSV